MPSRTSPEPTLWITIRESLAGSHEGSYTAGSIDRAIVLFAIPLGVFRGAGLAIAFSVMSVVSALPFRRGTWKLKRV